VLVGIEGVERYVISTRAGSGGCSTKWTSNNLQIIFDPVNCCRWRTTGARMTDAGIVRSIRRPHCRSFT